MNGRFIVGLCVLIIGLALCAAGLSSLLSPARYQAVVNIIIKSDIPSGDDIYQPYDPYFIQTEFKVIASDRILSKAIQSLNLDEDWGKQSGKSLNAGAVVKKLRSRIAIDALPNPRLLDAWQVEIRVTDENPAEAAQIANTIAHVYQDYRLNQYQQQRAGAIKVLEDEYQSEEAKLQVTQAQLEQFKKYFDATNSNPSLQLTNEFSYVKLNRSVDDAEKYLQSSKAWIQYAKKAIEKDALVAIIEPAVPPKIPIGPNRLLGAILLVFGIGLSALGVHVLRGQGAKFPKPR
jgi:uncharacterized protein involved in exopolysaccharide biosynthesis